MVFSEPKTTILDQSLGLEANPSNLERALSATQLPIVTTLTGWLISLVHISSYSKIETPCLGMLEIVNSM